MIDSFIGKLLAAQGDDRIGLICDAETMLFMVDSERERVMAFLLEYIKENFHSTHNNTKIAVGSAIRKYIAMMDVSRANEVIPLLKTCKIHSDLLALELEIIKIVQRKFEANPPYFDDTFPELANAIWKIAQRSIDEAIFGKVDYHPTIACLAIMCLVGMRSTLAKHAVHVGLTSIRQWISEVILDDLYRMEKKWRNQNKLESADWVLSLIPPKIE